MTTTTIDVIVTVTTTEPDEKVVDYATLYPKVSSLSHSKGSLS
jgi:hypothetical protein